MSSPPGSTSPVPDDVQARWSAPGGAWDVPALTELPPPSVIDGETRLSPFEVSAGADAVATGLALRGVRPGGVVVLHLPNWWEAVVIFHACWRIGAIALPVHARTNAAGRRELVERTQPALVFVGRDLEPDPDEVTVRGPADGFRTFMRANTLPDVWEDPAAAANTKPDRASTAVLLATSGSTGRPKLVRHTHRGLHAKARTMARAHGLTSHDTILMPAPLAHISGLLNGILLPGTAGMSTVLMDRWDPHEAADLVTAHHVTFMIGPPTFFVDLAEVPEDSLGPDGPLRLISSGGAAVTPAFVEATQARFGAQVKRTYGSTEAPTVTTTHATDDPKRGRDTDGRPTGQVELRVTDPSTGERVENGSVGALEVRGPEVCEGYLDPEATAAAFTDDGFFSTGDLATIEDGWLTIVGRLGHTIIRGGENIAPAAIEAAVGTLDGVRAVVAVGEPDPRLGQRVVVVIESDQPGPPLEATRQACTAAGLPAHARPDGLLIVDQIPRLAAGKPDRSAVEALVLANEHHHGPA